MAADPYPSIGAVKVKLRVGETVRDAVPTPGGGKMQIYTPFRQI